MRRAASLTIHICTPPGSIADWRSTSCTELVCDEFDPRTVSVSASEFGIASEQGGAQGFGERDIRSVIGGQAISQLPDPAYEGLVFVAFNDQIVEIVECLLGARGGDFLAQRQAP